MVEVDYYAGHVENLSTTNFKESAKKNLSEETAGTSMENTHCARTPTEYVVNESFEMQ